MSHTSSHKAPIPYNQSPTGAPCWGNLERIAKQQQQQKAIAHLWGFEVEGMGIDAGGGRPLLDRTAIPTPHLKLSPLPQPTHTKSS